MRLIDADKITFNITHDFDDEGNATPYSDEELTQKCLSINDVVGWLKIAPSVDAVEVVRCENCKHWGDNGHCDAIDIWIRGSGDFFCSRGERK